MTTVNVTKYVRNLIGEYQDGESVDEALNRLMDSIEQPVQSEVMDLGKTNIVLSQNTFNRLLKYKLSPNESHSDTILRLLKDVE